MSDSVRSAASGQEPDREVLAALRDLPRDTASPGFTEAVLARVETPAEPVSGEAPWSRSMMWLAASLVLVTVVTAGALERAHQRRELRGQVNALKSEHEQLQRELAEIKKLSADQPDVVYLGGDDNVDVVWRLDPSSPSNTPEHANAGGVVPAHTERN